MPYIGRSLGDGVRARYIYAATSGQTSFSGNDANGIALAYSDTLYMDVYQNGVLLKPVTDYASTTGTSVVLVTGASTSDVVEMIVYDSFAVADTVSAANGGTFSGTVSMSDDLTVDSGTLFVDASANAVGIGTTSPASTLTVAHASGSDGRGIRLVNSSNNQTYENRIGTQGVENTSYSIRDITQDGVRLSISTAGEITMPAQPAFQVRPATVQSNIGVSTNVDIVFGTEVFDVGSNFASNTFTAPVSGKYFLSASIRTEAVDSASNYYLITIVTSNRGYQFIFDPDFGQDAGFWVMSLSHIADMDASDTAKVQIVQHSGTQQTDITTESTFSGALIC